MTHHRQRTAIPDNRLIASRAGHIFRTALSVIVLFTLGVSNAAADETAIDFVEPRIFSRHFEEYTRAFNLTRDQLLITSMLFEDYKDQIDQAIIDMDAFADVAGRETVEKVLSGSQRLTPDQLRLRRAAVLEAYRDGWTQVDLITQSLIDGVQALLFDDQRDAVTSAVSRLRRQIWLHPRQRESGSADYAGDGVDLLQLLDRARAEGGELAQFPFHHISDIVNAYEHRLDALLIELAPVMRNDRMSLRIASTLQDDEKIRQAQQHSMIAWAKLYQFNENSAMAIGDAIEAHSNAATANRWRARWRAAAFPWMYEPRKIDLQYQWLMEKPERLTDQQRAIIEPAYIRYRTKFDALSREAVELMVRARVEHQTPMHALVEPTRIPDKGGAGDIYEELLKNSGQIASNAATLSETIEELLDENLRRDMRRAIR